MNAVENVSITTETLRRINFRNGSPKPPSVSYYNYKYAPVDHVRIYIYIQFHRFVWLFRICRRLWTVFVVHWFTVHIRCVIRCETNTKNTQEPCHVFRIDNYVMLITASVYCNPSIRNSQISFTDRNVSKTTKRVDLKFEKVCSGST